MICIIMKNMGGEEMDQIISDNRGRIYDYIKNHPGTHLRRLSKNLAIAIGDTQHHLGVLDKLGLIKSRRKGMYKVYYTVSILGKRDEDILAVLQQETPRGIILFLVENPGSAQGEISRYMSLTAPTINWHMSNLINVGLVTSHKEGRFVKYFIDGDVNDIIGLLKSYYPTIWNKLSGRLAELFLDLASASRPESTTYIDNETISKEEKLREKRQDES
ncbi:MAG: winged helix-turn-helix transcriptional regulator [Nitrososphaeraceae archaeon]